MAWCPTLGAEETSCQVTYNCKAKHCVCLWIVVYTCDWYANGDVAHKGMKAVKNKHFFFINACPEWIWNTLK